MPQDAVDITNGTIAALASRADAREALPFLLGRFAELKRKADAACRTCGAGRAKADLAAEYDRVKTAIVALSGDNLAKFKVLLDAKQVRVLIGTNHQGVPVRHVL